MLSSLLKKKSSRGKDGSDIFTSGWKIYCDSHRLLLGLGPEVQN